VLLTMGSSCVQQSCPLNGHGENALVDAVARAQRRTVVVLETGGPVLTPWRDRVAAVVEAWYPGQQGGTALAHVLWGDVDPGGRLPATFPAAPRQVPTATRRQYPGIGDRAAYSEGLLVGYRWYDAHHLRPAYPFGAGLSYTTFRYSHLAVRRGGPRHAVATVTLDVTDTGRRAGVAVPQLYVSKPHTRRLSQPPKQLVGGTAVRVPAGRTVRVSLPLDDRSFASWDPRAGHGGSWRALPGCYRLRVGTSSRHLFAPLVVGRGAGCRGADVHLPTAGHFFLPLPPGPSVTRVGRR
jgi:beta-glucosidase